MAAVDKQIVSKDSNMFVNKMKNYDWETEPILFLSEIKETCDNLKILQMWIWAGVAENKANQDCRKIYIIIGKCFRQIQFKMYKTNYYL